MSVLQHTAPRTQHSGNDGQKGNGLDVEKILGGAAGASETEYSKFAQEKYGRLSHGKGRSSQRYRELMYGGYKPIEAARVFGQFLQFIKPYKGYIILAAVGFLAAAFLQSARILVIKFIIDSVLPNGNVTLLVWVCAGLVMFYLLRNAIGLMCQYLIVYVGGYVVFDVRKRLFDHLQLLHIGFYEKEMSGKLITRLIYDVTALQQLIQSGLTVLVLAVFTFMVNITLMLILSWRLTLWSFWVMPAYWAVTRYYKMRLYRKSMEVRERRSILVGNVTEVVLGAKVVKSFAMEDDERKRFNEMLRDNLAPEMDMGVYNTHRSVLINMITGMGLATIFLVGGLSIMRGGEHAITLGTFVAFSGFLTMLYNSLTQVANLKLTTIQAQTGLERVLAVLEVDPEVKEDEHPIHHKKIKGHVEFEDVRFAYDEGPEVLHGVSLTAEAGQTVALVGPSGSGKSTAINLLTRFYDPAGGKIKIDDYDLRRLHLKTYRSQIGIVLQDPFLFSGTIEDNIRYGRPDATYEEVCEAADQANAMEFIEELPDQFNTLVGERGGLLSGGQRQRISIARALLKRPKILILDEATSSLDTQSEGLVQEAMDRLMSGRTVFVIAHRLSTVRNADKIIVMRKGKVVQEGTHDELLEVEGLYRRLYRGAEIKQRRKKRDAHETAEALPGLSS
jgi:subfamily B ATP-binding cassette protein MsbA